MNIQVATTNEDREDAFSIRKIVFVEEQKVTIEEEMDAYDDDAIHFIGYQRNIPIAASRLRFIKDSAKLERICVLKDYRHNSYGTELIQAMEAVALTKGYITVSLNAQTRAKDFYQRLGYKVISEEFLDARIPHVTMTKQLNKKDLSQTVH